MNLQEALLARREKLLGNQGKKNEMRVDVKI